MEAADDIPALQQTVVESLSDPSVYVATGREELCLALKQDRVFGIYEENTLIAAAICIRNRDCDGNLGQKCGFPPKDCYTFDAVFVHPAHRGQGLQRALIQEAQKAAKKDGAASMWCTVSPQNPFSYNNFLKMGFAPYKTNVLMYGGKLRDILKLTL